MNLLLQACDIVAVTESFLDDTVEDAEISGGSWSVLRRDRGSPCGGVLIVARPGILLQRRRELETDSGEDLWVSCNIQGRSMFICVIYIKPSASDEDYMNLFCKIESFIFDLKGLVVILGDLNLNSASYNIVCYYSYFVTLCGLTEHNNIVNTHGSILDVVLVQEHVETIVSDTEGMVPPDLYHPPLNIKMNIRTAKHSDRLEPSNISNSKDWNFRKLDYEQLLILMSMVSWDVLLTATDVQSAITCFYRIMYDLFDLCMPKKNRKKGNIKRYPVWFTNDIIRDVELKLKLHSKWIKTKCVQTYARFSEIRSNLKACIPEAYENYIRRAESNIKANPLGFWDYISSLRVKGGFEPNVTLNGCMHSGVDAAEAFANFFADVFLSEVPKLSVDERRWPISLKLAISAGDIIVQRVYAQTQRALSIPVTLILRWDDCSKRPVTVKARDRRLIVLSEARG
ncbi:unnamed protein product, partial [Brenthis ino]